MVMVSVKPLERDWLILCVHVRVPERKELNCRQWGEVREGYSKPREMLEMMMGLSPIVTRWATVAPNPVTAYNDSLAKVPLYAVAHCCAAHGTATQLRTRSMATTTCTHTTITAASFPPSSFLHRLLMLASSLSPERKV
jgi:hypothetical protein